MPRLGCGQADALRIFLIGHDVSTVMEIADRIVVLNHGPKIAEGPPAEVRGHRAAALRETATAILVVEQNARAVFEVADRVVVLERGRVLVTGTPQELAGDELGLGALPPVSGVSRPVGGRPTARRRYARQVRHQLHAHRPAPRGRGLGP